MISFQQRVLDRLEGIARADPYRDLTTIQVADFSNGGRLLVQTPDWKTVATAEYHFQHGHNQVVFNCEPKASMRKLGTPDGFLFAEHEDDKVEAMFARWSVLVRGSSG